MVKDTMAGCPEMVFKNVYGRDIPTYGLASQRELTAFFRSPRSLHINIKDASEKCLTYLWKKGSSYVQRSVEHFCSPRRQDRCRR